MRGGGSGGGGGSLRIRRAVGGAVSALDAVRVALLSLNRASWRIFTPLLRYVEAGGIRPEPYQFGSRGPKGADRLRERVGHETTVTERDITWANHGAAEERLGQGPAGAWGGAAGGGGGGAVGHRVSAGGGR